MSDYVFFRNVIRPGDVIMCGSIHQASPHFYEVSSICHEGWYSQPACFLHRYPDILRIFRFDGESLVCIWSISSDHEV